MIKNREIGRGLLNIQQNCELRTIEQFQREAEDKYRIKGRKKTIKGSHIKY